MADEESKMTPEQAKAEHQRLKEEKKKLQKEQKEQKKAAKQRAKQLEAEEAELYDDEEQGGGSVFLVTFVIVLIWIGILCLVIKLDLGGFGSNVLAPVLKDVPVLNLILPKGSETSALPGQEGAYGGYSDLKEAVDYIKELELELERANSANSGNTEDIAALKAEIERLKTFEDQQESDDIKDFAKAYSEMKPKQAAAIFESMTDNLDLVARILNVMDATSRGKILGVMDQDIAARITKIMDPEY